MMYVGGTIAYQQGNIKMLTEDWLAIKPTIMAGVPRVYSKIYDKVIVKAKAASALKRFFFSKALNAGTGSKLWDKLVWSKVRATVGWDEVEILVTGAAPIPPYLGDFLKMMCNAPVIQAYGMTETSALGTVCNADDKNFGHCGIPYDNMEIRLQSVTEMNYLVTDTIKQVIKGKTVKVSCPRGEVQMRGPSVFQGYYKQEDKTKETITESGWLMTGDIGRINPNGTLSIIDRKKNIFKTAFAEYIMTEMI